METLSSRRKQLKAWMVEKDITFKTIAQKLGISWQRTRFVLVSESITPAMHEKMISAGVPSKFLPPICDRKAGGKRRMGTL